MQEATCQEIWVGGMGDELYWAFGPMALSLAFFVSAIPFLDKGAQKLLRTTFQSLNRSESYDGPSAMDPSVCDVLSAKGAYLRRRLGKTLIR